LTLSDGSIINLNSSRKGNLAIQANIVVNKEDSGLVSYKLGNTKQAGSMEDTPIAFNTLSTPRGGQYQILLCDGTKVWLNAQSTLRYPVVFGIGQRKVELEGEAYFEVTKDKSHPFLISAKGTEIKVLGTHFNVNAYPDEALTKTTLAEGSVNINGSVTIRPGQQATVDKSGMIKVSEADLESTLAWKDGLFLFKAAPITEVMGQVGRWYDADIHYTTRITDHFNATIPRAVPVSELLRLLSSTGAVQFSIDNHKITVMK
jgi:transmembrane sensor